MDVEVFLEIAELLRQSSLSFIVVVFIFFTVQF